MSVPTHGLGCHTRTFPTKCRHCGDDVFFFSCSCGSRVFFDELGPPWPVHDCKFSRSDQRWALGRTRTKRGDGSVRVEISDGVTATRPAERPRQIWNIHSSVVEAEERNARSREDDPIEMVPPGAERTTDVIGVIREIDHHVDAYQRLDVPPTPIGKALLNVLGSGRWGRMTIHVLDAKIYSYTVWVPASALAQGMTRGVTVSAQLERLDIARIAREWVCTELRLE